MKKCKLCGKLFDPEQELTEPAEQAGQILAEEEYGDAGELCTDCLANRGRLAMMYRCDCY